MRIKHLIIMITVLLMLFGGRLAAEEIVGESIFPCIETPHPYPQPGGDETLVWSTTIDQPGAAWIKIHFSSFQLDDNDFVILINEHGRIIETIHCRDVNGQHRPRFNLQKNEDKTVNFWAMAVDGQQVRVELHRNSNNSPGFGFTIDEIGIGSKPIFDRGLGPVYNDDRDTDGDFLHFFEKKGQDFVLSQTIAPEQIYGRMLYKRGSNWYKSKGMLVSSNPNQILPIENGIDSQEVVNTLEVRFYSHYYLGKNDSSFYQSFYGDRFIDNYLTNSYGQLTLKKNTKKMDFHLENEKPGDKSRLSTISSGTCTYCCLLLRVCTWYFPPPPFLPYRICVYICFEWCTCTCPCCCCPS